MRYACTVQLLKFYNVTIPIKKKDSVLWVYVMEDTKQSGESKDDFLIRSLRDAQEDAWQHL